MHPNKIRCGHCDSYHTSIARVRECAIAHPIASNSRPGSPRISTVDDVERILALPGPRFADLIDSVRIARSQDRWDLVEQASDLAIASVGGEVPGRDLAYVARQLVATRIGFDTDDAIEDRLRVIAAEMKGLRSESTELISIAHGLSKDLLEVATLIADDPRQVSLRPDRGFGDSIAPISPS